MDFMFKLRYYLAKYLIWAGITVLPENDYKQELIRRIYGLKEEAIEQAKQRT